MRIAAAGIAEPPGSVPASPSPLEALRRDYLAQVVEIERQYAERGGRALEAERREAV